MNFFRTCGERARAFVFDARCEEGTFAAAYGDVLFDPRVGQVDATFELDGAICRFCFDYGNTTYIGRGVTVHIANPIEFYGQIRDPAGNPITAVELDRRAHAALIDQHFAAQQTHETPLTSREITSHKLTSTELTSNEIWYSFIEETFVFGPAIENVYRSPDRSSSRSGSPRSSPSRASYPYGFEKFEIAAST